MLMSDIFVRGSIQSVHAPPSPPCLSHSSPAQPWHRPKHSSSLPLSMHAQHSWQLRPEPTSILPPSLYSRTHTPSAMRKTPTDSSAVAQHPTCCGGRQSYAPSTRYPTRRHKPASAYASSSTSGYNALLLPLRPFQLRSRKPTRGKRGKQKLRTVLAPARAPAHCAASRIGTRFDKGKKKKIRHKSRRICSTKIVHRIEIFLVTAQHVHR
jgi:hypothetical protein